MKICPQPSKIDVMANYELIEYGLNVYHLSLIEAEI